MDLFSIVGKNIIVTGASGHLGLPLVEALLKNGCNVLALSRQTDKLLDLSRYGNLTAKNVDVTDENRTEESIADFYQNFGQIWGLVNNASSSQKGISLDQDKHQIVNALENNFIHYWTTARISVNYFDKENGGSIVNVGSLFGNLVPNLEMYLDLGNEPNLGLVASKGAVHQLSKYLAIIWADKNIRVNTLVPGFFPKKRGPERLDYLQEIYSKLAIKRIGNPKDLFGPIIFLLSDASRYMTGTELIIDGGYSSM